jgi:hypothetical protein
VEVGESRTLALSRYFRVEEGVRLHVETSNPDVSEAVLHVNDRLVLTARAKGAAEVTVTAFPAVGPSTHAHLAVRVPNRPPVLRSGWALDNVRLMAGTTAHIPISFDGAFRDPDGDDIVYVSEPSNPALASVSGSAEGVAVKGLAGGETTIRVWADDGDGGRSTPVAFEASIVDGGFPLHLRYVTPVPFAQRRVFEEAAFRWSMIVRETPAREIHIPANKPLCGGNMPELEEDFTGNGVLVNVVVAGIDGPHGVLAQAAQCATVEDFPSTGLTWFDAADVEISPVKEGLGIVALHELGHVMDIGFRRWRDMLRGGPAIPYFAGPQAVREFDKAGGEAHRGPKVPVQPFVLGHWSGHVMPNELMAPRFNSGPLSAVTVRALADMGWTVDVGMADDYELPRPGAAPDAGPPVFDLSGDLVDVGDIPEITIDGQGNIVIDGRVNRIQDGC